MIETTQLSSGVTTHSPTVVWLPNAKVTTVRRKRSAKSHQKTAKRDFEASLLRIANSPATVWHDFGAVCESAGL